jgi:putative oxidoreductase
VSVVAVAIGTLGAGAWSLDGVWNLGWSGWVPMVVTLVIGFGGTAGLLAVFWRPDRTTSP